jgi:hypothetical protein
MIAGGGLEKSSLVFGRLVLILALIKGLKGIN